MSTTVIRNKPFIAKVKTPEAPTVVISRALLREAINELTETLSDIGGCDHPVNICCCSLVRLIEQLDEVANGS